MVRSVGHRPVLVATTLLLGGGLAAVLGDPSDGAAARDVGAAAPASPTARSAEPGTTTATGEVRLRLLGGRTFVVRGTGPVHGRAGRVVRYTVEVQADVRRRQARAAALLEHVERVFSDTDRGWTARGERRMRRVPRARDAHVRVVLAPRGWVDRVCGRRGMRTAGRYSCWTGRYAALNLRRWRKGMHRFPSLDAYRTYLINHEVGHGLGYRHRACPRRGALAPVMVPQSRSLYGCRPNGWPYPRR